MKFFISTISSLVSPGISQVVRSLIRETLVAISLLWLSTKLRSNRLKPHNHLLLMILVLLPMIPILSALVLNCNKSNNFGLWPFRIPLYILAVLWYNWSSIGGALTRWGTRADRAIFGRPHNLRIALRHVEQKLLMWQASSAQAWDPYMWQHCDKKTRESISFWIDLKFANKLFVLPIKSHRFFEISSTSLRSYVTMFPRCFTLLTQDKALSLIYNVGGFSR